MNIMILSFANESFHIKSTENPAQFSNRLVGIPSGKPNGISEIDFSMDKMICIEGISYEKR